MLSLIFLVLLMPNGNVVTLEAVVVQHLPRVKAQFRLETVCVCKALGTVAVFFRAIVKRHTFPDLAHLKL